MMTDTSTTPPTDSIPALRSIAMPADTNPDGDIFGGWLLSQMDLASATVASREASGRVVTVAVDAMTFLKPVYVGDEVSCYCQLIKRSRSSMAIQVEAWVQRHHSSLQEKVTEGVFTLVAINDDGRPRALGDRANVKVSDGGSADRK